ncbi:hypothetical protein SBF1_770004 [Candidatus Desulfosporosinus infrequens]|uniref:Uncharacterized protein n=1 Tax=Candidatus Desulfosporosinus infrequens TaxID=2043169 RepID=A0A2U3LRX4_9FIRM|nr:hypothetical protein SBF1_770004 [Candidatus Desulfosporosinus infrequens]
MSVVSDVIRKRQGKKFKQKPYAHDGYSRDQTIVSADLLDALKESLSHRTKEQPN